MTFPSLNDRDALLEAAPVRVTAAGGDAAAAMAAAQAAQEDADAALAKLTDIESDNKLTPSEKPVLAEKRDAILAEQTGIEAQATALGITTEKTAYTNAISALATYLALPALVGWNVIPGNTITLTGTTFRSKFVDIYAARQALLNKITAVLKANADAIRTSSFEPAIKWEFRNSLDGWTVTGAGYALGVDSLDFTANTTDPLIYSPVLSLNGKQYDKIRMKVMRTNAGAWQGQVYYTTAGHDVSESYTKAIPDTTVIGEWVILEWDMAKLTAGGADWTSSTITKIRIDLGSANGVQFSVDWIAIGKHGVGVTSAQIEAFANDGILDRSEKAQLHTAWLEHDLEYAELISRASALGVNSTQLQDNHTYTSNYLVGLSPGWSDTTQDTVIDRTLFRNRFKWLAEAKEVLRGALAAKAATMANANSITGMNHFRILTQGNGRTAPIPAGPLGISKNGAHIYAVQRSYTLIVIRRSDGAVMHNQHYDVYGTGQVNGLNAGHLAADLNWYGPDFIVVVYTYDEPRNNRFDSGLLAAMYRCGASPAVFGSPEFKSHSAYCLIGIPGCGPGGGAEFYQGEIDGDPNAWIDVSLTVTNGNYTVSGQFVPRTLRDYGYTGSLNASSNITLIGRGVQVTGNNLKKTQQTEGWDADAYSRESAPHAYAMATVTTLGANLFFGLNDDPTHSASWDGITFSFYLEGGGVAYTGVNSALTHQFTVAVGDVLMVTYDGVRTRWYKNGALHRQDEFGNLGVPFYFDSSFAAIGGTLANCQFGPITSALWGTIGGAGRPADNATVGAPAGTQVAGLAAEIIRQKAEGAVPAGAGMTLSSGTGTLIQGSSASGTTRTYGTKSISVGGTFTAPVTWSWVLASFVSANGYSDSRGYLIGALDTNSITLGGYAGNDQNQVTALGTARDASGLMATIYVTAIWNHGSGAA